jgi:hypothetical protein
MLLKKQIDLKNGEALQIQKKEELPSQTIKSKKRQTGKKEKN